MIIMTRIYDFFLFLGKKPKRKEYRKTNTHTRNSTIIEKNYKFFAFSFFFTERNWKFSLPPEFFFFGKFLFSRFACLVWLILTDMTWILKITFFSYFSQFHQLTNQPNHKLSLLLCFFHSFIQFSLVLGSGRKRNFIFFFQFFAKRKKNLSDMVLLLLLLLPLTDNKNNNNNKNLSFSQPLCANDFYNSIFCLCKKKV